MSGWEDIPIERRKVAAKILTDRQLSCLTHRINGHSWRTIGKALGITEATARGHYDRALETLANHYRKENR